MESIIIDNGTKKIRVNEEGEYIEIPMKDRDFPRKFYNCINSFHVRYSELEKQKTGLNDVFLELQAIENLAIEDKRAFEELFGEGSCRKVFGNIKPDSDLYLEFFDKLAPLIGKFGKERTKEMIKRYGVSKGKKQ